MAAAPDCRYGPPVYLTRFVLRRSELANLRAHVRLMGAGGPRLVTLLGLGGAGKTRLAAELVGSLTDGPGEPVWFRDAVQWVDLSAVGDPDRLSSFVAHQLGLAAWSGPASIAGLVDVLRHRRMLLVFDNCEQLAEQCGRLAARLLEACAEVGVLATSREPLIGVDAVTLRVEPLACADAGQASQPVKEVSDAATLFHDRAAMALPGYAALGDDPEAVEAICRTLGGLPLAIELVAPWVRAISAIDLLAAIRLNLDLLTSDSNPERQRSLQAVLSSMWTWLNPELRSLLGALAVFTGEFSREAAEAVGGASAVSLAALAERSLIVRVPAGGLTRYTMHPLVRLHLVRRLMAGPPGERSRLRDRHLIHFLDLTERAASAWDGPAEREWLQRLARDEPEIDAALDHAIDTGDVERALRLAAATLRLWMYASPPALHAAVIRRLVDLPADGASTAALSARARVLNAAAWSAQAVRDYDRACAHCREASELYLRLGDDLEYASSVRNHSFALTLKGDHETALRYARHALDVCRRCHDDLGTAWSMHVLAHATLRAGRDDDGLHMFKASLAEFDRLEVPFGRYDVAVSLGDAYRARGDVSPALDAYATAVDLQRTVGFTSLGAHLLDNLAELALLLDDAELAAFLLGAAAIWDQIHGREFPVIGAPEQRRVARSVRARLATDTWTRQFGAGARCSTTEAQDAAALAVVQLAARVAAPLPSGISSREADVLRLLGAGLSNTDIAGRRGLSPRTVAAHLRSVYTKLGVRTRTAAVYEARRLGLR